MRGAFFCVLIDPADDIAGFVIDWIRGLAARLDHLDVIALEDRRAERPVDLPANVTVHSLGKENGRNRLAELAASQKILSRVMGRTDFLLCHMMPIYAVAAGPWAKLYKKPLLLWYTHQNVDLKLKVAVALADRVVTAVDGSMGIDTPKKRVLGHGINFDRFHSGPPRPETDRLTVVSIGRLSPVKRLETLIEAAKLLKDRGALDKFRFDLIGQAGTPAQQEYVAGLKRSVEQAGLGRAINFVGSVPYLEIAPLYHQADVFLSCQSQLGLDKALLEAMASGLPTITANSSFFDLLGDRSGELFFNGDRPGELADRLAGLADLTAVRRTEIGAGLRDRVLAAHGLDGLVTKIIGQVREVQAR